MFPHTGQTLPETLRVSIRSVKCVLRSAHLSNSSCAPQLWRRGLVSTQMMYTRGSLTTNTKGRSRFNQSCVYEEANLQILGMEKISHWMFPGSLKIMIITDIKSTHDYDHDYHHLSLLHYILKQSKHYSKSFNFCHIWRKYMKIASWGPDLWGRDRWSPPASPRGRSLCAWGGRASRRSGGQGHTPVPAPPARWGSQPHKASGRIKLMMSSH